MLHLSLVFPSYDGNTQRQVQHMKSMRKKQLSAADIAARTERVHAISSVVPLEQAPEQALQYYTHLTDVKLRSVLEPQWGIYIAESSKVVRRALDAGHQRSHSS